MSVFQQKSDDEYLLRLIQNDIKSNLKQKVMEVVEKDIENTIEKVVRDLNLRLESFRDYIGDSTISYLSKKKE